MTVHGQRLNQRAKFQHSRLFGFGQLWKIKLLLSSANNNWYSPRYIKSSQGPTAWLDFGVKKKCCYCFLSTNLRLVFQVNTVEGFQNIINHNNSWYSSYVLETTQKLLLKTKLSNFTMKSIYIDNLLLNMSNFMLL